MQGRVSSIQSMGTLDGPGVRFVVFMQGCPLRCACCHNPETWDPNGGTAYTAEEIFKKAVRYRPYFKTKGGSTLSGGEPLLQPDFLTELFSLCRENGIHTCLDTSGCLWNQEIARVLSLTDYVLLDMKYTTDALYQEYVGCSMSAPLQFLEKLQEKSIPTVLRQVIIPGYNDTSENINALVHLKASHSCVQKTELLPFRKICISKYEALKIPFPFANIPAPSRTEMKKLESMLQNA